MITITKAEQAAWFARNEGAYIISSYYPISKDECMRRLARGRWNVEFGIEWALCLCCHITQKQAGFVWATIEKMILGKGDDYAGENRFSAFLFAAEFAQIREPETVIRAQIGIKIHRLENLLQSKGAAKFESVADNAYDLLGYCILFAMMQEKNK
jgi:hypothetical protein